MSDDDVRYVCRARLDDRERMFLWESGDNIPDSVVVDDDGFVLTFESEDAARAGLAISSEPAAIYDLDAIAAWCGSSGDVGDHKQLLNAWNLFVDLPHDDNLFSLPIHGRAPSSVLLLGLAEFRARLR